MIRRLMLAVLAVAAITPLQVLAHEGHDHKVLGTVTMAAADHVMLKDKDNKDHTVYIAAGTKVLRDRKAAKVADITPGLRVVITAATVKSNGVEKMVAKQIDLAAAPAAR